MPKLKPTCTRKTKNSWSLWTAWSQSGGWYDLWKRWVFSMVTVGGEGNDELTCVRSYDSDKSSWSVGRRSRRSSLGSWFQRQGDAWRKERLLIFREEEEGEQERVTTSEERVLRLGWTEIRLYRYEGWVVVRMYVRETYSLCPA